MFVLSDKELKNLTGTNVKSKQIQNLRENGIPFTVGVDGRARVIHSVLMDVMLHTNGKKKSKQPDFSKLDS